MSKEMKEHSLAGEAWREYSWPWWDSVFQCERIRTYRIADPRKLFLHEGCTTHRVLDGTGVVHLVPSVGLHGCTVSWQPRDSNNPVQF